VDAGSQSLANAAEAAAWPGDPLQARFRRVRALTAALVAPLSEADACAQSMPDASPAKWHAAHTTWFFDTFLLAGQLGARPTRPAWDAAFNSYYLGLGRAIHPRAERGLLTRPALAEVLIWRDEVEAAVEAAWGRLDPNARAVVETGLAHEEQHQELLLTDLLDLFSRSPLAPAYRPTRGRPAADAAPLRWVGHSGGVVEVGAGADGFAFDCERPRHEALLRPFAIASRAVTNAEWEAFAADGGYATPSLWLSDGWAWRTREAVTAPLHWRAEGMEMTLAGLQPRDPSAPVAHVSHYEADAFAAWAGARLPTEAEWEAAATAADPDAGNQLDAARAAPRPAPAGEGAPAQLFGDVWEWTASAFLPHPGFRPAPGLLGEYNGKFMSGQMVLKGGSCATPRGHLRVGYRNFFPPTARWQFSGLRLAKDA
jgi:ergothioneine biosynthesis protein EgtB